MFFVSSFWYRLLSSLALATAFSTHSDRFDDRGVLYSQPRTAARPMTALFTTVVQ